MRRLRFWLNGQLYRFLGTFKEVRDLRALREEFEQRQRALSIKELEHRKAAEQHDILRAKAEHKLADTKRALEVMTEARLNADRAVEVLRGQMQTLSDTIEHERASMKQMVDFFGLQSCGRQIFGTAPLSIRPKDEGELTQPQGRVLGRHLVQQQTVENFHSARADAERFMKEAEDYLKNKQPLPNNGPEYSSTSKAVEDLVTG